jgi:putative transposase
MEQFNIKTYKYKCDLSSTQTKQFDNWISLCKEVYNLLIEQRLEVKRYNDIQYYAFYPEKAEQKRIKDLEYKTKLEEQIASGKRKARAVRPKFITPIKQRHPELLDINTDVLTHLMGCNDISQVEKFKNTKQAVDKPVRLNVSWQSQSTFLTILKTHYHEFSDVPSDLLAHTCKQVDQAFKKYEDNLRKYKTGQKFPKSPKFVKFSDDFTMMYMRSNGFELVELVGNKKIRIHGIPKVKEGIKVNYHKKINGEVRQQSLVKEGNDYFLCITFKEYQVHWEHKNESVGIDLGVARNIQLSDGTYKDLPVDTMKSLEKQKANLQRGLRRKKLKSSNYDKLQCTIAKIDKKMARIRKYYSAMYATEIARDNNVIVIEDLKIKNMTKSSKGDVENPGSKVAQKSGLNKSILRIAPYMFRMNLETKCKEYGRSFVVVDPKYTSQMCSSCGVIHKESRISQDMYKCIECGHEMNADHNAAINILNKGIMKNKDIIEVSI